MCLCTKMMGSGEKVRKLFLSCVLFASLLEYMFKELLKYVCFKRFIMNNGGILQSQHYKTSLTKLR